MACATECLELHCERRLSLIFGLTWGVIEIGCGGEELGTLCASDCGVLVNVGFRVDILLLVRLESGASGRCCLWEPLNLRNTVILARSA